MTDELGLLSAIDNRLDLTINVKSLIMPHEPSKKYTTITLEPAIGVLYVTEASPGFVTGHMRMRGRNEGRYPFKYLETIDHTFGYEPNTIECAVAPSLERIRTDLATRLILIQNANPIS